MSTQDGLYAGATVLLGGLPVKIAEFEQMGDGRIMAKVRDDFGSAWVNVDMLEKAV